VLEEQRLAAKLRRGGAVEFLMAVGGGGLAHAVGDFRNLKQGTHARLDAGEFAVAVEEFDEVTEGFGAHGRWHRTGRANGKQILCVRGASLPGPLRRLFPSRMI